MLYTETLRSLSLFVDCGACFLEETVRCDCFLEIIDRNQHRIGCSEHFVQLFQGSGLQGGRGGNAEGTLLPARKGERARGGRCASSQVPGLVRVPSHPPYAAGQPLAHPNGSLQACAVSDPGRGVLWDPGASRRVGAQGLEKRITEQFGTKSVRDEVGSSNNS